MEASTPPAEVSVKCLDRTGHCGSQPAVRGASWPRPALKASSRKTSEVASPETTGKRGSRSAQIGSRNGNWGHGRWVSAFPCAADTAGRWPLTRSHQTFLGLLRSRLQGRRRWADDGRDGITETRGATGLDQTQPVSFARIPNQEPPTPPASACRDPDRRPAGARGLGESVRSPGSAWADEWISRRGAQHSALLCPVGSATISGHPRPVLSRVWH